MNKYEVMSNGIKIEILAEYVTYDCERNLQFTMNVLTDEDIEIATFKDWSYVRKI